MIALIDYGAGNLTSVKKAFGAIGIDIFVPGAPADLESAAAAVVPGVGHFGATRALSGEWSGAIRALIDRGRPLLGICLGMQWLFERSDEAPDMSGLGIFSGCITRLDPDRAGGSPSAAPLKVPHVGWNAVSLSCDAPIVRGIADGSQVYFTHSYAAPRVAGTVAVTTHGETFSSIVQRGSIAGVQFHPEKSGEAGLQILRNFAALVD
jgi:imidazole glycerol-phosphate synthase subunit HisH